ncbi:hypothetical protein ACJMK2_016376 [Sinanodonta woodiana]|uniref:CARD domain-containing protein n=1 Tax=Sinanodonta woodiana TaxID=1069815 RepID=A0ABD3UTE6_SINWO
MENKLDTGSEHFFDRIRANYVKLEKDLDVTRMMPYFFQNQLLEIHDMEELSNCQLQRDRVRCFLLQKCIKMNQVKVYKTFIHALRELNLDHILEMFPENPKSSSASAHALTQAETCRKKDEKDVEVQTDLTCFSGDPALSAYFVCQNCRRHSFSFSNSADVCTDYEDGMSLLRAPEDEHGYTVLGPRDETIVDQRTGELQCEGETFTVISDTKSTTYAEAPYTRGLVYLTHVMVECPVTSPIYENMNHPDLAALKEEVMKLEGWRPDVNESNVKDKARAWEGQQGYYFLWWHKRSKRDSMKQSTRSSVSRHGRFIVSVWSKRVLLHYKILDKRDENQQKTYYVDKSFSSPSISELIDTWTINGVSVKEDKL